MRTLVISDIHGCYDKFKTLLEKVSYNYESDKLVLLGDYIDRGSSSRKVINLVIQLVFNGAIALKGNHEDMLLKALDDTYNCQIWLYNGGKNTLRSYYISGGYGSIPWYEQPSKIPGNHINFIRNLPTWYEDENYIFVHAGLSCNKNHPSISDEHDLMWIRNDWINSNYNGKTVVFGHTPTMNINKSNTPWFGKNKICIDTGAVFGKYDGKLTCLQLPEEKYWQM